MDSTTIKSATASVITQSAQSTSREIYVPPTLRKFVKTVTTPTGGTRLAPKS